MKGSTSLNPFTNSMAEFLKQRFETNIPKESPYEKKHFPPQKFGKKYWKKQIHGSSMHDIT